MTLPKTASRDERLAAGKELLTKEKAVTLQQDAQNIERRNLPMVEIDKEEEPKGLAELVRDNTRDFVVLIADVAGGVRVQRARRPGNGSEPRYRYCDRRATRRCRCIGRDQRATMHEDPDAKRRGLTGVDGRRHRSRGRARVPGRR